MKIITHTVCTVCETEIALVIDEPRYNGYRGICFSCKGNWPES